MSGLGDLLGGYGSEDASPQQPGDQEDLQHLAEAPEAEPAQPMETEQPQSALDHDKKQQDEPIEPPGQSTREQKPPSPSLYTDELATASLPPDLANPPPGDCDPDVQARVARWLSVQSQGKYLTQQLRSSRDYRNPEFFKKMIEYWEIDQYGTHFDSNVYDPTALPQEDHIKVLQQQWAEEEQRRRQVRQTSNKIEFTKGEYQQGGISSSAIAEAKAKAAALAAKLAARH